MWTLDTLVEVLLFQRTTRTHLEDFKEGGSTVIYDLASNCTCNV